MKPTRRSEMLRLMRKSLVAHGIAALADTKTIRLMMLDKIIPLLTTAMIVVSTTVMNLTELMLTFDDNPTP